MEKGMNNELFEKVRKQQNGSSKSSLTIITLNVNILNYNN
jgi:hypothetical protein